MSLKVFHAVYRYINGKKLVNKQGVNMFSDEITVERGIQPPNKHRNKIKYDWCSLKTGDSFVFDKKRQTVPFGSFKNWQKRDPAREKYKLVSTTISNDKVRFFFLEKNPVDNT